MLSVYTFNHADPDMFLLLQAAFFFLEEERLCF